jgi:hypothetical protein
MMAIKFRKARRRFGAGRNAKGQGRLAMTQKVYCTLVGALFVVGALVHLCRLFFGWPIVIAGWNAPLWASWIGLIIAGVPGFYGLYFGLRASRRVD